MRSSRSFRRGAVVAGVGALTTVAILLASGDREPHAPGTSADPAHAPGGAALRAQIDPETGELIQGPLPGGKADAPELQEMLSRSTEGLVQEHQPDGAVRVHLQGRFQNASMARVDSSGKVLTTCVDTADAAHSFCKHETTQTTDVVEER